MKSLRIAFTKMQGAGNDFVVIDATARRLELTREQWRWIADRRFGVGADQILVVEAPAPGDDGVDFVYRIFNADGGEVEQCGNGARCFVKFVRDRGLTDKRVIRVRTRSGVIAPRLLDDGRVEVDMGPPSFEPVDVPFTAAGLEPRRLGDGSLWPLALDLPGQASPVVRWVVVASMGNPHAVQRVDSVGDAPVAVEGPQIEAHPRFPRRVNAGFMEVVSRREIRLRVHERGAGETLACGTGACAAVAAGIHCGLLDTPVEVHTRGGRLTIHWEPGKPVMMTGPAQTVFSAEVDVPERPELPDA